MKNLLIGILIGIILFNLTPVKAMIPDYILKKVDYKIIINGKLYKDENLPILNYEGHTYAPLKSILSAAELNINWNEELKQAEVNGSDNMKVYVFNEVEYLKVRDIFEKYNSYNFSIGYKNDEKILNFIDKEQNILIENVPFLIHQGLTYIENSYYLNEIFLLIK